MTYNDGYQFAILDIEERIEVLGESTGVRLDRRSKKLNCKAGYEQRGAACQPIKKSLRKPSNAGLIFGGVLAGGAGVVLLAPPLIMVEDVRRNITPKDEERPPRAADFTREELDKRYSAFQEGDIIRHTFPLAGGADAWHYAIYSGRNQKTGEHEVIDVHEAPRKEGVGRRHYVGRRSAFFGADESPENSVFEKLPNEKLGSGAILDRNEIMARARAIGNGQEWHYSLGRNNCETFVRAVVENNPMSRDGEAVSIFTKEVGKATIDTMFTHMNEGRGLEIPELQRQLDQASKEYRKEQERLIARKSLTRRDSVRYNLDSSFAVTEDGANYFGLLTKESTPIDNLLRRSPASISVKEYTDMLGLISPYQLQRLMEGLVRGLPPPLSNLMRVSLMTDYLTLVQGEGELIKALLPTQEDE